MAPDPLAGSPFPGLGFAGELDDLNDLPMEVTMTEDWLGWVNQRLLTMANANHPGRLAYLKLLPDPEQGMVIMVPAASADEYGAIELKYTETENGAFINLRRAVQRCNVAKQEGRIRVFPVVERQAPNGQTFLAFVVKGTATRPSRKLKKSDGKSSAPQQKPAEAQQPQSGEVAAN